MAVFTGAARCAISCKSATSFVTTPAVRRGGGEVGFAGVWHLMGSHEATPINGRAASHNRHRLQGEWCHLSSPSPPHAHAERLGTCL